MRIRPKFPPRGALAAALGALVFISAACARQPTTQVFIPLQKTARQQYQYALDTEAKQELVLSARDRYDRMLRGRETVLQGYARVVEYFPEDREVTPLARMKLAEITCGQDISNYRATDADQRDALKQFEKIMADYPENDFVQAKAKFDQAMCYRKLKEYERAQTLFKEVEETYIDHKDQGIKRIVYYAHQFYQQTYVK